MSYRKHGFWVLIERCFKQTAMKYFDDSIKLSPYRQFCWLRTDGKNWRQFCCPRDSRTDGKVIVLLNSRHISSLFAWNNVRWELKIHVSYSLWSHVNKTILVWVCTAFMKPGHHCFLASEHVVQHPWELLNFSLMGCLHDTSMTFILVQVHCGSLSFLCTCLRDYIWCVSSPEYWYQIKFSFWCGNPYQTTSIVETLWKLPE